MSKQRIPASPSDRRDAPAGKPCVRVRRSPDGSASGCAVAGERMTGPAGFSDRTGYQAQLFQNRVAKRYRHLRKWARRTDVTCYRLYDRDIPEVPLAADLYQLASRDGRGTETYVRLYLYERPFERSDEEESLWLSAMAAALSRATEVPVRNVLVRTRRRQRGTESQYEKDEDAAGVEGIVLEKGLYFKVNLSAYLDTGLFLDHRPLRETVRSSCGGKSVLNLFCYTGSFSVYAAAGGASRVVSVDLSNTYLSWARENFLLNGFSDRNRFFFVRSDVADYIFSAREKWDIIVLDPPTFSNSKKTRGTLDIKRDWPGLVGRCLDLLNPGGVLYFSTNSRRLVLDERLLPGRTGGGLAVLAEDISARTIPEDFRNARIHRCWRLSVEGSGGSRSAPD